MKKLLLLSISLFICALSYAQDPDLFRTWYLSEVQSTDLNDVFVVSDIDPPIQPWVTISETLEYNGEGACNTFMGTYTYDSQNAVFMSVDLTETGLDCNNQTHNLFENDYFDFMQAFQIIEITPDSNGLTMRLSSLLLGYAIFRDYPLSVNDATFENDFTIYPNPVSNQLFISSENLQIEKISIYSMSGKQVLETELEEESIDVSNLSEGLYFIEVTSYEGKSQQKFIKK